MQEVVLDLDL